MSYELACGLPGFSSAAHFDLCWQQAAEMHMIVLWNAAQLGMINSTRAL
jgi:hypothetical protein